MNFKYYRMKITCNGILLIEKKRNKAKWIRGLNENFFLYAMNICTQRNKNKNI